MTVHDLDIACGGSGRLFAVWHQPVAVGAKSVALLSPASGTAGARAWIASPSALGA